ncbi:MAG: substrate-binding domain-containing protein [Pirellulales bacterium]
MRRRVALLFEDHWGDSLSVMRGILQFARQATQWEILVCTVPAMDSLRAWNPHGLIVHHPTTPSIPEWQQFEGCIVSTSRWKQDDQTSRVTIDDVAIGQMAAHHFQDYGLERLYYVGVVERMTMMQRNGMVRGGKQNSIPVERLTSPWHLEHRPLLEPLSQTMMDWFRKLSKPAGIFVRDDWQAVQMVEHAKQLGIRVPGDLYVLGMGNVESICDLSDPSLSSIQLPMESLGAEAARVMDALLHAAPSARYERHLPPQGVAVRWTTTRSAGPDPIFDRALRYIREHYTTGITIKDVVRNVGISRSTLERRFKEHLGIVPTDEILRLKIKKATELLTRTELPIRDVAEQCGFGDSRTLNHAMLRAFGVSAQEFRNQTPGDEAP